VFFKKKIKKYDNLCEFENERCQKDRNNTVTKKKDNNSNNISSNEDKDKVIVDKNVTRYGRKIKKIVRFEY